jgi:hypothetical protein
MTAYGDDAPTYYPSSARDTAAEIPLQYGAEATGIDIRYRGEPGHSVSGTIADNSPTNADIFINVMLVRASTDTLEAVSSAQPSVDARSFAFYGVPDGDYYLLARRAPNDSDDGAASKRTPIKVRGRDVSGLGVTMISNGSIAGRLTLDIATASSKCESTRPPAIEETLLTVQTEEPDTADSSSRFASPVNAPDRKGDFVFSGLPPGRYQLDTRRFIDEAWYVRAVTLPGPTGSPVSASNGGINVRSGQRINGIRIVLGEGAASLRGRIVPATLGTPLPDRLRVHLVPEEQASANDLMRFFDAEIFSDNSFRLPNLAPGRYLVFTRQRTEEEAKQRSPRPLAWNATSRASLRRLAQASNTVLELKPCQRISDFQLPYAPVKETTQRRP